MKVQFMKVNALGEVEFQIAEARMHVPPLLGDRIDFAGNEHVVSKPPLYVLGSHSDDPVYAVVDVCSIAEQILDEQEKKNETSTISRDVEAAGSVCPS